ncbi:MAG: NAD-dependent epimerase/dehydratase family protein [Pyrinomonadaceae bacterium]|nr:NAD-dependent epimerase/dehydratase family protein [Pyrinomonadaceae bacterium]
MKGARCLVTGATGAIGPGLVGALMQKGYAVQVLLRQTSFADSLPNGVRIIRGDLLDQRALVRATSEMDTVFHLAAKLHINNPGPSLKADFERINVEATRQLVKAAEDSGAKRFVYFSTICVYGPSRPGQVLAETDACAPQTFYARTKLEAEKLVLAARSKSTGEPIGTVLRLAAVYGARMKGNYPRLVSALRGHRFLPVGNGLNRRTLVHEQDAARAALLAAEHPNAVGQIYNVTDGEIHSFNDILRAICNALGRGVPRMHLPLKSARLLAGMLENSFQLVGRQSPLDRAAIARLVEDAAVSGEKIQGDLGFRPSFDLAAGWQQVLQHCGRFEPSSS